MKRNIFLEKLQSGEHAVGTFFHSGSGLVMEAIGLSGMDFVIIDKEHSPIGVETTLDMIRAAECHDLTPFVRIKDISRPSVLKLLDIGAKGLIVPAVEGFADVKKIVEFGKYPPIGNRGMAMGRGVDFGIGTDPDIQKHWNNVNRDALLIPMCETRGCLEQIEEIAALDGVDGIFVGPCDLSIALGKPGQFDDHEVESAFRRVVTACRANNKFSLIFAGNAKLASHFVNDIGFDGIANGIDTSVVLSSYLKIIKETRAVI